MFALCATLTPLLFPPKGPTTVYLEYLLVQWNSCHFKTELPVRKGRSMLLPALLSPSLIPLYSSTLSFFPLCLYFPHAIVLETSLPLTPLPLLQLYLCLLPTPFLLVPFHLFFFPIFPYPLLSFSYLPFSSFFHQLGPTGPSWS